MQKHHSQRALSRSWQDVDKKIWISLHELRMDRAGSCCFDAEHVEVTTADRQCQPCCVPSLEISQCRNIHLQKRGVGGCWGILNKTSSYSFQLYQNIFVFSHRCLWLAVTSIVVGFFPPTGGELFGLSPGVWDAWLTAIQTHWCNCFLNSVFFFFTLEGASLFQCRTYKSGRSTVCLDVNVLPVMLNIPFS